MLYDIANPLLREVVAPFLTERDLRCLSSSSMSTRNDEGILDAVRQRLHPWVRHFVTLSTMNAKALWKTFDMVKRHQRRPLNTKSKLFSLPQALELKQYLIHNLQNGHAKLSVMTGYPVKDPNVALAYRGVCGGDDFGTIIDISLRNNEGICLDFIPRMESNALLRDVGPDQKRNPLVAAAMVERFGTAALPYLDRSILNLPWYPTAELNYWRIQVPLSPFIVRVAPQYVKDNIPIALEAMKHQHGPTNLFYFADAVRRDHGVVRRAIRTHVGEGFRSSLCQDDPVLREFALRQVLDGGYMRNFPHLPNFLKNHPEVALKAVNQDGMNLEYTMCNNVPEIAAAAVKENTESIRYVHEDLLQNTEFVTQLWMLWLRTRGDAPQRGITMPRNGASRLRQFQWML